MPCALNMGSMTHCMFGLAPTSLVCVPEGPPVLLGGTPAATMADMAPYANIEPYAMCTTPSNPEVDAEEGAPAPCTPLTTSPWAPPMPTVLIDGVPLALQTSTTMCAYAGEVSVVMTAQVQILAPA